MRKPARWCAFAAAWVVTSLSTVALAQPKPDPAKLEQAKQHMAAGSAFYNDPSGHKCEEAVREFSKAYELSGSWKALRAQAICELQLERDGAAIDHYEEVLRLAGSQLDAGDKAQIENDLRALKSAVATFVVRSNQPGAKLVTTRQPSQGLPITNSYEVPAAGVTIRIHPGAYTFTATKEGFADLTWKGDVSNGSRTEKTLEFQVVQVQDPNKPPPPKTVEMDRPVPVTVWIFAGLTGASAITMGTFMGLAKVAKDDYDAQNGTGVASTELEDMRSDVVTKNIVADVFIGVTAASLGATLIFYFTRPEVPVGQEAAFTILPQAGPDFAGATLVGSF